MFVRTGLCLQGRVACEINSGDELVATEVIFAGVLAELEPEEAVALLSALVFQVSLLDAHSYALIMAAALLLGLSLHGPTANSAKAGKL